MDNVCKHDIFGSLFDWGSTLALLEKLKVDNELDQHQDGLIRILRYRANWNLRQRTLNFLEHLTTPNEKLLHQVLSIVDDEHIDYDSRVLAVRTMHNFFNKGHFDKKMDGIVGEKVCGIMSRTQPIYFHSALKDLLDTLAAKSLLK